MDQLSVAYSGPGGVEGVSPHRPASSYSVPFVTDCCKALVDELGIAFFFFFKICFLFFGILQKQRPAVVVFSYLYRAYHSLAKERLLIISWVSWCGLNKGGSIDTNIWMLRE